MTAGRNERTADPDILLELHNEFSQLATEDKACEGNQEPLYAYGKYENGTADFGTWSVRRGTSSDYRHARFEELATRAGIAAGAPAGVKPLAFWLHQLYLSLREKDPDGHLSVASRERGFIQGVCAASATSSLRLAKTARECQNGKLLQRTVADSTPLPKPLKPVGGSASVILPHSRLITGWMRYQYPSDFPEKPSRDRIKSAEIMAARDFNEKSNGIRSQRELLALLVTAALRPARIFCEEAVRLGWSASRIDSCLRDFIYEAQVWVGLVRYQEHVSPELQRQFEQSKEWKDCQDIFLASANDDGQLTLGIGSPAAPEPDAPLNATLSRNGSSDPVAVLNDHSVNRLESTTDLLAKGSARRDPTDSPRQAEVTGATDKNGPPPIPASATVEEPRSENRTESAQQSVPIADSPVALGGSEKPAKRAVEEPLRQTNEMVFHPKAAELIRLVSRDGRKEIIYQVGHDEATPIGTLLVENNDPLQLRAAIRAAWMDRRHPDWTLPDWRNHTGLAYETLKSYRAGVMTRRTPYVRGKLAKGEKLAFSIVPE